MRNIDDNPLAVILCITIPPIALMIGWIIIFIKICIDTGLPTDIYGWLYFIAFLLIIPFGYAFSIILPVIFGGVGILADYIIEKYEIKNYILYFLVCLFLDVIAGAIIYFIYESYFSGESDIDPEPLHLKNERL